MLSTLSSDPKIKPEDVTIAVVLALPREMTGAQVIFTDEEELDSSPNNGFGFTGFLCRIPAFYDSSCFHSVVLAVPPCTGNNHSAICVEQLFRKYDNLKHVILCGIAGGVPTQGNSEHDVHLGDIVVVNKGGVLQHDFGHDISPPKIKYLLEKQDNAVPPSLLFLRIDNSIHVDKEKGISPWKKRLDERLPLLAGLNPNYSRPNGGDDLNKYDQVVRGWFGKKTKKIVRDPQRDEPKVFYGRIASGNCLLKNPFRRDALRDEYSVLAVEMEAAGVAAACNGSGLDFTVVRGICDYCDSNKNDRWQHYAAAVAASYAYCVVERIPYDPSKMHKVDGKTSAYYSWLENINMEAAKPDSPSASSSTGLEYLLSNEIIEKYMPEVKPSRDDVADAQDMDADIILRQYIHEIKQVFASHDWNKLLKVANSAEDYLENNGPIVNKQLHAELLHEIARCYVSTMNLVDANEKNNNIAHARKLIDKAKGLIK